MRCHKVFLGANGRSADQVRQEELSGHAHSTDCFPKVLAWETTELKHSHARWRLAGQCSQWPGLEMGSTPWLEVLQTSGVARSAATGSGLFWRLPCPR